MRRLQRDDRGQSITLDYALALGVGFVLVTGLIIAGGDFVGDQRDRATRAELRVVGQQLAGDLAATDRLVQAVEGEGSARIERRIPEDVARSAYWVRLVADEEPRLRLRSVGSTVSVRVELVNETRVAPSNVTGGLVVINHTGAGRLRIEQGERYA